MSVAVLALRMMPRDMQVHTLAVAAAEGSCTREQTLADAHDLGVVPELLEQFEIDDTETRIRLGARYLDPWGKPWASLTDDELRERRSWCMRPEHHDGLTAEVHRRADS